MPLKFSTSVVGKPNFSNLVNSIKNPTGILRRIKTIRETAFRDSIRRNLDASGKRLTPLSAKYAAYKRRKVGKQPIRVFTGKMVNSYRSYIRGKRLFEVIDDPKAVFHQEGTGRIPQRKLLPTSFDDMPKKVRQEILEVVIDEIEKSL